MTTKTGTLYGIGVGPGDPELITLKALKVLHRVPHIFAACSTKNSYSLALSIVRCHLNGAGIEHLPFPMSKDARGAGRGLGAERPAGPGSAGHRQ